MEGLGSHACVPLRKEREVTLRAVLGMEGLGSWARSIIANCGLHSIFYLEAPIPSKNLAKNFEIFLELLSYKMFTTSVRVQYWKSRKIPGVGVLRGWYSMQASKDLGCNADQTLRSILIAFHADHVIFQAIHCIEKVMHLFQQMELSGLVPNSYIHVSVSDLYFPRIGLPIWMQQKLADRSWEYINCSLIHYNSVLEITRPRSFISGNT